MIGNRQTRAGHRWPKFRSRGRGQGQKSGASGRDRFSDRIQGHRQTAAAAFSSGPGPRSTDPAHGQRSRPTVPDSDPVHGNWTPPDRSIRDSDQQQQQGQGQVQRQNPGAASDGSGRLRSPVPVPAPDRHHRPGPTLSAFRFHHSSFQFRPWSTAPVRPLEAVVLRGPRRQSAAGAGFETFCEGRAYTGFPCGGVCGWSALWRQGVFEREGPPERFPSTRSQGTGVSDEINAPRRPNAIRSIAATRLRFSDRLAFPPAGSRRPFSVGCRHRGPCPRPVAGAG